MPSYNYLFLILFLLSCNNTKRVTGFTIEKEREESWASIRVESAQYVSSQNYSGRFLKITHKNGRSLELFVSDTVVFSINEVIEEVELTNNSNEWPFSPTTFTRYDFEGIYCNDSVMKVFLNFSKTGISIDRSKSVFKSYRFKFYEVEEYYLENIPFCLLRVKAKNINEYNKWDPISGEPHYRKSEIPTYMFSEQDEYMNILIVAHERNCGC